MKILTLILIQLEPLEEYRELREEQDRLYNESLEADKAKVCVIILQLEQADKVSMLFEIQRRWGANAIHNIVLAALNDVQTNIVSF